MAFSFLSVSVTVISAQPEFMMSLSLSPWLTSPGTGMNYIYIHVLSHTHDLLSRELLKIPLPSFYALHLLTLLRSKQDVSGFFIASKESNRWVIIVMTFLSWESYFRSSELFWFCIVNGFDLANWSVSLPRGNKLKMVKIR